MIRTLLKETAELNKAIEDFFRQHNITAVSAAPEPSRRAADKTDGNAAERVVKTADAVSVKRKEAPVGIGVPAAAPLDAERDLPFMRIEYPGDASAISADNYNDILMTAAEMSKPMAFLEENKKELKGYHKDFKKYKDKLINQIEKLQQDIYKDKIDREDIGESAAEIILKTVENELIAKLFRQIAAQAPKNPLYRRLAAVFTDYLRSFGIFTYNRVISGGALTDDDYNYYKPERCIVSDKKLDGKVKQIGLLSYGISFVYRGEVRSIHTEGELGIYKVDD